MKALSIALFLLAWSWSFSGCSTASPFVNWDKRIGNYTYDLALVDLGLPIASETRPDGSLVAEWLIREANSGSTDISAQELYVPQSYAESPFPLGVPPSPDRYLRLTFGRDRKLNGWQRFQQY